MRPGQPAMIRVDTFGRYFKGRVRVCRALPVAVQLISPRKRDWELREGRAAIPVRFGSIRVRIPSICCARHVCRANRGCPLSSFQEPAMLTHKPPINPWFIALPDAGDIHGTPTRRLQMSHSPISAAASVEAMTKLPGSSRPISSRRRHPPDVRMAEPCVWEKDVLPWVVALFTLTSLFCGLAPPSDHAFKPGATGHRGRGLAPVSQAILVDTFPPRSAPRRSPCTRS